MDWTSLINSWRTEFILQPFFLLQALAVVGILSIVLFRIRDQDHLIDSQESRYGLALGLTGFLLTLVVIPVIQGPARPYLRSDLLFLAGLLGGWRGGAICAGLIAAARLIFGGNNTGGWTDSAAALIDISIAALGGVLMHSWFTKKSLSHLNWKDVLIATLGEKVSAISAMLSLGALGFISKSVLLMGIYRRGTPVVSFLIVGGSFFLFRREAEARADRQGQFSRLRIDALTGLPNRIALREYLDSLFANQASCIDHTLVLLEVNNVADMVLAYGHDWQTLIWSRVLPLLQLRTADALLHQFDPEYFLFSEISIAIVLHNVAPASVESMHLIPNLQIQLQKALSEEPHSPAIRFGFAVANAHGAEGSNGVENPSAADALRNLTLALQASDLPIRFFNHSLVAGVRLDEQIRLLLLEWIKNCSPPMMYQPKCSLTTYQLLGAEALLRGDDPSGAPLQPLHVLDVARRHQLSAAFEWCTVEAVVRHGSTLAQNGTPLLLSVNISAASLAVPSFGRRVAEYLEFSGLPGSLLCVEVTEVAELPDIEIVHDNFRELRQAGVSIALDDFGAGYSALSVLGKFSFNELKIDSAMIARLEEPRMKAAVSLALETANRYDARLVAEGVETQDQARILHSMGLEYGQGYLFGRALPVESLVNWTPIPSPVRGTASG